MRAFQAIGAALLILSASPPPGHANGTTPAPEASPPPAPGCHCPRPHRRAPLHVRHWRAAPIPPPPPPFWPAYNPPIPSPYDSAYGRVMTQYTLGRQPGGEYLFQPGYWPEPPIAGLPRFRIAAGGVVYEYDIMADGYVQLTPGEAQRVLAVADPPR